jgi:hypothetical protein
LLKNGSCLAAGRFQHPAGRLTLVFVALAAGACGPHYGSGPELRGDAACARVDSFLARSFPRPVEMHGRATFDVESYRVRGRFQFSSAGTGDAVLEFSGTALLGGHREDVVISLSGDTLRVLDRERGRYYEGDDVERMVESGTRVTGAWALGLRRALAAGCGGVEAVREGEDGLSGSGPDGAFGLRVEAGRLQSATWPNPAPGDTFRDRLDVRYAWRNGALRGIEARLPTRGWRVRLEAD